MRSLYPLYAFSGFVSLGYQVAWFRIFVDRFGSTNLTFAFVLVNFLGGLGAGSLASRPFANRLSRLARQPDPLRLYGLVELAIAAAALLTLALPLLPADAWGSFPYLLEGSVQQPTAVYHYSQLAISVLCVFVPCFLMGVTFPLLCRAFRSEATLPSTLYAWNTLGACTGVLASEFVLLPWLGHHRMFVAMVAGNVLLGAWFLLRRSPQAAIVERLPAPAIADAGRAVKADASKYTPATIHAGAIVGGLLTGAFEADVLRRVQFLDCRTTATLSCISFWAILAIFLASCTVRARRTLSLRHIQAGAVVALVVYALAWHFGYPLRDWTNAADNERVIAALPPMPPGLSVSFAFWNFGYGIGPILWFTGLFVFAPFYLLSLLLPYVCNLAQASGRHLGLVYGGNTAAFCTGLVGFTTLAPLVNTFYSMRLFFGTFVIAVVFLLLLRPDGRRTTWFSGLAAAALVLLAFVTPASFAPSYFTPGSPAATLPIRNMRSDGTHTTYVVGDPTGDLLYFDSYSMSGCNLVAQQYMRLMAHFPLLAQANPSAALLICFGVGNTASAIAAHESMQHIDIVDLDDQVFATAPEFAATNHGVIDDPRVRLVHDDGRRFLALTDRRYDLITSEPPPPMMPGVSRLYSLEYYRTAKQRLQPGGIMTQWLPIDQFPLPAMRAAIATFVQVFPHAVLFTGHGTNYILMGSESAWHWSTVERRFAQDARVLADLQPFGIERPVQLFARIVKCGPTLQKEFGDLSPIRDEHNDLSYVFHDPRQPPVVTYDPAAMLAELDAAGASPLACRDLLARTVMHLGRLKTMVQDFPEAALMSVRATSRATVAMAATDWNTTARRLEACERAIAEQQLDRAISQCEQAVALAPEYPLAALRLGVLLSQANRWEPALNAWQLVLAVEPDEPQAGLGAAYSLVQLQRLREALELAVRLVRQNPRTAAMHRVLGDALAAANQWAQAAVAYDRALALDPADAFAKAGRERCRQNLPR
ncbi:MAG TPA: tetratricopeptide repeat protein [Planctomycetota bacterium]|nr:tetratricopeptide repeat protein [Planctomycetota bacterium]